MKKFVAIVAVIVLIICMVIVASAFFGEDYNEEFIRLHIRANSNSAVCQAVKYQVRGSVVTALSGAAAEANSFSQMRTFLQQELSRIEQIANNRLMVAGKTYRATARIAREDFPARMYNGVLLPSGYYYALIIELGTGQGNNWWCVIYPQLCFVPQHQTNTNDLIYRSWFLGLFKNG